MNRVDDSARNLNGEALANAVGSAGPTGINESYLGAVLLHIGGEEFSVLRRVPDEERFTEARGKGRLRLFDANFSTGDLGGVAADEVIHCLFRGQLANRR